MRLARWRTGERVALAGVVLLLVALPLPWFGLSGGACTAFGGPPAGGPGAEAVGGRCAAVRVAEQLDLPGGWGSLGIGWALLLGVLVALVVAALVLALRVGPNDPTAAVVTTSVLATALALLLVPALLLRALVLQPDLGLRTPGGDGLPAAAVAVAAGGWLGLLGAVLLLVGMWRVIADERRDAPDSQGQEVPLRPAPVPGAGAAGAPPRSG